MLQEAAEKLQIFVCFVFFAVWSFCLEGCPALKRGTSHRMVYSIVQCKDIIIMTVSFRL